MPTGPNTKRCDGSWSLPADYAVTRQLVVVLGDDNVFSRLLEHMAFGDRQPVHGDSLDPKRVYPRMYAFRAEFLSMLGSKLS